MEAGVQSSEFKKDEWRASMSIQWGHWAFWVADSLRA